VKFYKFYFFLSFTLYLAPALPALPCPPPAPAPAIENVARRHQCPIIRTWVSGPRYLALRTWVSGPRKLSILRSSYLFPVTFLCVQWSQTDVHTESDCPGRIPFSESDCPGRFRRRIKTRNRRVTDGRTHALREFIYKMLLFRDKLLG
jgi:hypothetical protein